MEQKQKGILISILVLLIILILGVITYIVYDQGLIFNNNEKIEIEENKNDIIEKDIDNTDEKMILKDIVGNINTECVMEGVKLYDNLNLTDKEKLQITLNSIFYRNYLKNITLVEITEDEVRSEYYNIFNEELKNNENIGGCPIFNYDVTNKKYNIVSGCGKGTPGPNQIRSYINKYTSKGNEYYVYINLGATRYNSSDEYGNMLIDVYTDKDATKFYKTQDNSIDYIDQTNCTDFSEYKYTFIKRENGTYYFKSIEKIEK